MAADGVQRNWCHECRHSLVSDLKGWLWCAHKPKHEYMSAKIGECPFVPVKFERRQGAA